LAAARPAAYNGLVETPMFFRREKPAPLTFAQHLDKLTAAGFSVSRTAGGGARVVRQGFAADVREDSGGAVRVAASGLAIGDETGLLTDVGYQKIFTTASGKQIPALAEHLRALHAFVEDLREALEVTSLYNEGLGTTTRRHHYDRVAGRDNAPTPRAWQR
jgi:hypothetical protein